MLKGTCLKCGSKYWGWALTDMQHQTCSKCGSTLVVTEYGEAQLQSGVRKEDVAVEDGHLAGSQNKASHQAFGT